MKVQAPTPSWTQSLETPASFFGFDDYDLFEEDGSFVLTVEMPGFEREDIELTWHDGRLDVAAEHTDEARGKERTYHRAFRFPKAIDEDAIDAAYRNGVLEEELPIEGQAARGTTIEIEG